MKIFGTVFDELLNKMNVTYIKIKLSIFATYKYSPPATGYSVSYLKINQPPYGGTCSVNKYSGTALSTYFMIMCSGWMDIDGYINNYEYYRKYLP